MMIANNKKSFTLVEMITVMVMIGVLLGLILTGSFNAIKEARIEKAKAAIKITKTALDMFEADVGFYPPWNNSGNKFKSWLQDGWYENPGWMSVPNSNAPYMNFIDTDLNAPASSGGNQYMDPWGNAYEYRCPGTNGDYDIWVNGRQSEINSWD